MRRISPAAPHGQRQHRFGEGGEGGIHRLGRPGAQPRRSAARQKQRGDERASVKSGRANSASSSTAVTRHHLDRFGPSPGGFPDRGPRRARGA